MTIPEIYCYGLFWMARRAECSAEWQSSFLDRRRLLDRLHKQPRLPSRRQHSGSGAELLYRGNKDGRPKIRIRKDATADRAETVGVGWKNTPRQKIGSAIRESHRQNGILPRYRSIDLFEPLIIEACLIQFVPNGDWSQSCPPASTREAPCCPAPAWTDSRSQSRVRFQR